MNVLRRGRLLKFVVTFAMALIISMLASSVNAQQGYGRDTYGNCKYGAECSVEPPPKPTTIVTVPPSSQHPQAGRVISTNITDQQVFDGSRYRVLITPNFPGDQITRVVLLLNDQIVGESTQFTGESFVIDWQLPNNGYYTVSVLVYLADGSTVRQGFQSNR